MITKVELQDLLEQMDYAGVPDSGEIQYKGIELDIHKIECVFDPLDPDDYVNTKDIVFYDEEL